MSSDDVAARSSSVDLVEDEKLVVDEAASDRKSSPSKTFECPMCQREYSTAFNLRRHIRKAHEASPERIRPKKKSQRHESFEVPILSETDFEGLAFFQILVQGKFASDSSVSVHRLF